MSGFFVVDVGTQSPEFQELASQEWATVKVRYHGFADLPSTTRGQDVISPNFTCMGHTWRLKIYPGGVSTSHDRMVAIYLYNLSDKSININASFCVKRSNGTEVKKTSSKPITFRSNRFKNVAGFKNFANHSTMMNSLVAGALIIEVGIQRVGQPLTPAAPFIPENPSLNFIQQLFMDEKSADVMFEVGTQKGKTNSRKVAKTTPVTFYAHRLILQKCASQLAELCGSGGKDSPVSITDVEPEIFRHLLHYVYGGKVAEDDLTAHAKGIIEGADKYGIGSLKLEAEASFVKSTAITVENMMEHLLYADAKNCALLKEAVMDFIVENKVEVLENASLNDIPGGHTMFRDILAAVARGEKRNGNDNGGGSGVGDRLSTMRISDLRIKVHEKGLDVDGSRETLIAALKEDS